MKSNRPQNPRDIIWPIIAALAAWLMLLAAAPADPTPVQTCAQLPAALAAAKAGDTLNVLTPGEITGLTFNDIGLLPAAGSGWNIHGNTFENIASNVNNGGTPNAIWCTGCSNSHFDGNTFSNVAGTGIFLYPGNNITVDGNTFTNVFEPVHAMGPTNGTAATGFGLSGNVATGASRNAFELQNTICQQTIHYNYVGQWNPGGNLQPDGNAAHMALSDATGGSATAPFANQGNNIDIGWNTFLLNGRAGQTAATSLYALTAMELFGANITVHDNFCSGAGLGVMNGAVGPASFRNNTWIVEQDEGDDGTAWPPCPLNFAADISYAWNASNAPVAPTIAATLAGFFGSGATLATQPAAATQPAIVATPGPSGTATVTFAASSSPQTISIYASTLPASTAVNVGTVAAGVTTAKIGNIFDRWQVTILVNGIAAAPIQVFGGPTAPATAVLSPTLLSPLPPATQPTSQPATAPATQPTTAPIVTHRLTIYSDGSIQEQ